MSQRRWRDKIWILLKKELWKESNLSVVCPLSWYIECMNISSLIWYTGIFSGSLTEIILCSILKLFHNMIHWNLPTELIKIWYGHMPENTFYILIFFFFKGVLNIDLKLTRVLFSTWELILCWGSVIQIQFNKAVSFVFCMEGDITKFLLHYMIPCTKWQYNFLSKHGRLELFVPATTLAYWQAHVVVILI
jgi:hypothetical protein